MDLFHNSVRLVIFLCVQISFLGLAFVQKLYFLKYFVEARKYNLHEFKD